MPKFRRHDRVRVSRNFFSAKGATGTITEAPLEVVAISGPWDGNLTRKEESALGVNTIYSIRFDIPQFDAEGDGPYRAGQIHENAIGLSVIEN